MLFEALLTDEEFLLLQLAVDRAVDLVEREGLELTSGEIAACLCEAYFSGARDPGELARAVLTRPVTIH